MRSLQEIVALPPSPSPQTIFCDGAMERAKGRFLPILQLMVFINKRLTSQVFKEIWIYQTTDINHSILKKILPLAKRGIL
ncbi:hypothetical protein JOD24_003007 [Kroppenstedtia sanguinis]